MAIARGEYKIIRDLKIAGVLPERPDVIELGESNWYGSVPYRQLEDDINQFVVDKTDKDMLLIELASCQSRPSRIIQRYLTWQKSSTVLFLITKA